MNKKISIVLSLTLAMVASLCVMGTTLTADAEDGKTFIGSTCSFADNPLASHNKIHHRFKNTSGTDQWVTCPIVRDAMTDHPSELRMETYGTCNYARWEQRDDDHGSLTGIDLYETSIGSGYYEYYFGNISADDESAYAFECKLPNNHFIQHMKITEGH